VRLLGPPCLSCEPSILGRRDNHNNLFLLSGLGEISALRFPFPIHTRAFADFILSNVPRSSSLTTDHRSRAEGEGVGIHPSIRLPSLVLYLPVPFFLAAFANSGVSTGSNVLCYQVNF